MKKSLLTILVLFVLLTSLFAVERTRAPFGLEWGMTLNDVKKVGTVIREIMPISPRIKVYAFIPKKGHRALAEYGIYIDNEEGLVKIRAFSHDIETSTNGNELIREYNNMKESLVKSYGEPEESINENSGSTSVWLYRLRDGEAKLGDIWVDNNVMIFLGAATQSYSSGFFYLTYEHEKFGKLMDEEDLDVL